jgi:hypothetical protein
MLDQTEIIVEISFSMVVPISCNNEINATVIDSLILILQGMHH